MEKIVRTEKCRVKLGRQLSTQLLSGQSIPATQGAQPRAA